MKNFKILSAIFLINFLVQISQETSARFKSVKCSSSNKTLGADYKCFIRAYNRNVAKLSVLVTFEKHCYEAWVKFLL